MRAHFVPAARLAALAAILVAGFVVSGCAQSAVAPAPVSRVVAKPALAAPLQVTVLPDLTYGVASGVPLRLDVCLPSSTSDASLSVRPAIVAIHGGSWMEGDKAQPQWRAVCQWLASAGYVVASVDYRLAPTWHAPDQLSDVERAVEWMRAPTQAKRFGIDPTLIGAFGGSAGGNLAALLGTAGRGSLDRGHRVAGVAELSGPADLTEDAVESPILQPRVLSYLNCVSYASCSQAAPSSPVDNVDSTDSPFFIAHSTNELVPLSQSLSLVDHLRRAKVPVTLVEVPGTLHSIAMLTPQLENRITAFFRSVLVHRAPTTSSS